MQHVDKPNFFPKTAAFEAKAPVPAAKAAAGGEGKEKKAAPVVTVVTAGVSACDVLCASRGACDTTY